MKMEKISAIFLLTNLFCALAQIKLSPITCNTKSVEKLSKLAITYINEDRAEGYKFALNRISNVQLHTQGPAGNVYYLFLDVLETICHVRSRKPWKRCDVRPFMETQISGNCNTTILHTAEGYSYLYSYDCTLMPDPPEKLQQTCPTCPLLLPVDSSKAIHAAGLTLHRFNTQSTLPSSIALQNLTRASTQTNPVSAIFVEYTVQECHKGSVGLCVPADKSGDPAGFCKGAVYGDIDQPDVEVACEIFHPQGIDAVYDATHPLPPVNSEVATIVPDITISVTNVAITINPSNPTEFPLVLDDPPPPLMDSVSPSSRCVVAAAIVGDVAEAIVGDVAEAIVGDVAEAIVGDVAEAIVGDVAEAIVGDVAEAIVGDVAEAIVGDVAEAIVGDVAEAIVGDVAEAIVGDVAEAIVSVVVAAAIVSVVVAAAIVSVVVAAAIVA
ncbi:hypothetical protein DPEC_G00337600 [Dallia pectoralis]|uniref:Uncharacterized protein n=1 Tax=Dallia pectoralis TaxID=75939 RepID=A0ACC2F4F7_DALPE|nr:hypothetical protein DPEC_G00337600 [Dallia pectoralis]